MLAYFRLRCPMACLMAVLVMLIGLPSLVFAQAAERPNSEELLPETTVAYVQLYNFREMMEKMAETNGGRMLADEKISPLVNELYSTAEEAYSEYQDRIGLSLEEIRELPAGEICFAVIAPRRKSPAFVLIIDSDEESESVDKILDRGREFAAENDVESEVEETDDVTYEKFSVDGRQVMMFRKGGTVVIGTDQDELDAIVERWMGRQVEKVKPLKENRKFITIMNRCRGTKDVANDFRFFMDPIGLAKSSTRGNAGAQMALNFLPILGLDGFLGVGGSMIIDEMGFESVVHMHVLLANPRAGIFEMLALKPGNYEPQPWVPHNAISYVTTSWDVKKMFHEFEKIYDSFSGEGALEEEIEDEINSELGIDFREDFIENISGRMTYVQTAGSGKAAFNGQVNTLGVGIKNEDGILDLVDVFLERIREEDGEDTIEEKEYKGVTYWQQPNESAEEAREEMADSPVSIRIPQPAFAVLEDQLIIADDPTSIERAIDTARGKEESLYNNEQFEMVSDQMTKLLGTDVPCAVMYNRPSESMRIMMEALNDAKDSDSVAEFADENPMAKRFLDAFKGNPLPDFEEIEHYFAPSGAFVTNDDTGYHFLFFQLKSDK